MTTKELIGCSVLLVLYVTGAVIFLRWFRRELARRLREAEADAARKATRQKELEKICVCVFEAILAHRAAERASDDRNLENPS